MEAREEIKKRLKDFEENVSSEWDEYIQHVKNEYLEDTIAGYSIGLNLTREEEEYFTEEMEEIFDNKI